MGVKLGFLKAIAFSRFYAKRYARGSEEFLKEMPDISK
jgi:hypothetical protein